jgi:type I restriction enzyme M protein
LNEWNEWQLKNLNVIVWLYRGEKNKYSNLLQEYHDYVQSNTAILEEHLKNLESIIASVGMNHVYGNMPSAYNYDLMGLKEHLKDEIKVIRTAFKLTAEETGKKNTKASTILVDGVIAEFQTEIDIINEYFWLYTKFGEGRYRDIAGLCKVEDISVILDEKGSSLTPGAYVGVAPIEDDGVDFEERMSEIHKELSSLQAESDDLMDTISQNLKEMGL